MKMWYIYKLKYLSPAKKDIMKFIGYNIDLKDIPYEVAKTLRDKCHVFFQLYISLDLFHLEDPHRLRS